MSPTACTEPQCLYSRAIPLLSLLAVRPTQNFSACTVELYLYSPYWPYGLYGASVPVQYSYTSTPPIDRTTCTEPQCLYSIAIPLLPLLAVRPVQSLSACTVGLYLYSPYCPYGLCRASVPVQGCTLPKVHHRVHKSQRLVFILSLINPVNASSFCIFLRSILISFHIRLGLPDGLFTEGLPSKPLHALPFSPIRATWPTDIILRDLINGVTF